MDDQPQRDGLELGLDFNKETLDHEIGMMFPELPGTLVFSLDDARDFAQRLLFLAHLGIVEQSMVQHAQAQGKTRDEIGQMINEHRRFFGETFLPEMYARENALAAQRMIHEG